jgi:hypothetical protein
MRGAARMHVNRRTQFGETPGGAGVIEMDVAKKNVTHIARSGAQCGERACDIIEGRFGAGIEEDGAFIGLERRCSDNAGPIEMLRVEDVDHEMIATRGCASQQTRALLAEDAYSVRNASIGFTRLARRAGR